MGVPTFPDYFRDTVKGPALPGWTIKKVLAAKTNRTVFGYLDLSVIENEAPVPRLGYWTVVLPAHFLPEFLSVLNIRFIRKGFCIIHNGTSRWRN